ncbi:hypothetical protein Y032_0039g50 [Ancylostoma ceylanicum]|uniref:Uncharacterized protein n=1 Tax=Ancylostoma ceylanicum TaxID=53326 RepID=A0A016UK03_9BILA|nr:hypothetical protein Y032_0039g50 [Ancylostoma ceylanicum]
MCSGSCRVRCQPRCPIHSTNVEPLSATTPKPTNVEPLNSVHHRAAALPRHHNNVMPSPVNVFDHVTPVQRHSTNITPSSIKQVIQVPFLLPPTIEHLLLISCDTYDQETLASGQTLRRTVGNPLGKHVRRLV